jgi:hypothetical protein
MVKAHVEQVVTSLARKQRERELDGLRLAPFLTTLLGEQSRASSDPRISH